VLEALKNRLCRWYVLKESTATDLVRAVHEVAAGRPLSESPAVPNMPSRRIWKKPMTTPFDRYETLNHPRTRGLLQTGAKAHEC